MRNVIALLFALAPLLADAQKQTDSFDVFYYTASWQLTVDGKHVYTRGCTYDPKEKFFTGPVVDVYPNGKPEMTGYYKNRMKDGRFIFFYPNDQVRMDGEFVADERSGLWTYYYSNRRLKYEVEFTPGAEPKRVSCYDSAGNALLKNGTGKWHESFIDPWDGPTYISGELINYKKVGKWILTDRFRTHVFVFEDGKFIREETKDGSRGYSSDYALEKRSLQLPLKFRMTENFETNLARPFEIYPQLLEIGRGGGVVQNPVLAKKLAGKPVVSTAETEPVPAGGDENLDALFKKNLRYPAAARNAKIEGRVIVDFIVEENGTISDIRVIKGLGSGCDEEAVRLVKTYAVKWTPAKNKGKPVRFRWAWSIVFKL